MKTKEQFKKADSLFRERYAIGQSLASMRRFTSKAVIRVLEHRLNWIDREIKLFIDPKLYDAALVSKLVNKRLLDKYEDGRWVENYIPDYDEDPDQWEKYTQFCHDITGRQYNLEYVELEDIPF